MSQSQDYGFCPNCGAVSKNGVCTSCGYKKKGVFNKPSSEGETPVKTVYDFTSSDNTPNSGANTSFARNSGSTGSKGYIGLAVASVACIIFFIAGFLAYHALKFNGSGVSEPTSAVNPLDSARGSYVTVPSVEVSVPEIETWDDDFFNTFAGRIYGNFDSFDVPEETAYAQESGYDYEGQEDYYIYDDFIRTDLDYKIVNKTWKYNGYFADEYGEGFPERAFIRCDYPFLESNSLNFVNEVNDSIADLTTYICDYYDLLEGYLEDNEVGYCEEYVYITYMSEDVLSLLFQYSAYYYNADDDEYEPELAVSTVKAVNFDMKTGEIMNMPEIAYEEDAFLESLVKDFDEQNGVNFLDMVSMDELKEAYEEGELQWFYNPIGVEFVYAFPDLYGYYSCTQNPGEVFAK